MSLDQVLIRVQLFLLTVYSKYSGKFVNLVNISKIICVFLQIILEIFIKSFLCSNNFNNNYKALIECKPSPGSISKSSGFFLRRI